jgi:hypothetical protein
MLAADTRATAFYHWMSVGKCVDRLVTGGTANEVCAHRLALSAPDDVRQQVAQLELDVPLGQEDMGQPVHRG